MVRPLNNYVLVKVVEEEKKRVILVINEEKRMDRGEVLAVAKEVDGLKKGDKVFFQSYSLNPVEVEGEEVFFIKADDVLAKI